MPAILVVDDRPSDRLAVCAALESLGCDLDVAMTGEDALERATNRDYAVMIIDLRLPTIDGITTATRIRAIERARNTPVLLMSSDSPTSADEHQFIDAGIIDFLEKPLDVENLRSRVSKLIERTPAAAGPALTTSDRLSRLQAVNEALSRALTPAAVAAVVLEHAVSALGANTCLVYTSSGEALTLLGHHGLPPEVASALMNILSRADMPGVKTLFRGDAIFTATNAEYRATFPVLAARSPMGGPQAAAVVPLVVGGGVVGVIAMGYFAARAFPSDEREFITTFARQCAFALERARLFEQQRALTEEARAAVRARDDFLSVASHELNTPLAALKLQLGRVLRHPPAPDVMMQRLHGVDHQVDRLIELVNELLDVSRLRAGRFELNLGDVDLAALIREVAARIDTSSRLQLALAEVTGRWDRLRLEQVITNLLSNALKYGDGKPVEVELRLGADVTVVVRDHGIGIAPEDQARIFDRFERAVSGQKYSGLGLGLWISRKLVEAHGGSITVESAPGVGSTFTLRLPR